MITEITDEVLDLIFEGKELKSEGFMSTRVFLLKGGKYMEVTYNKECTVEYEHKEHTMSDFLDALHDVVNSGANLEWKE